MLIGSAHLDEYATLTQPSDDLIPADPAVPGGYLLEPAYLELREKSLSLKSNHPTFRSCADSSVLAVLMETGYHYPPLAAWVVTVAAVAGGTSSVLVSRGPMTVGPSGRQQVRAAAEALLMCAASYIPKCLPAKSFPLPPRGKVRFYIACPSLVYTAQASEHQLKFSWHAFSELYRLGYDLFYEIGKAADESHYWHGRPTAIDELQPERSHCSVDSGRISSMRRSVDESKIRDFMQRLASAARSAGNVYFAGGATMLLLGLREQTVDVDIKLDPEPKGAFEAIASLKNELELNVELAAPDQFIPVPPDWRERSEHIATIGPVSFYHYDLRAQALSKIERGHAKDLRDVYLLIASGRIDAASLTQAFDQSRQRLIRYPAIDAQKFEERFRQVLANYTNEAAE